MFAFRLAHGLRGALLSGNVSRDAYEHYLALRPDVVLTSPLLLREVCSTHPGVNIISGARVRPMHFHDRDWDLGLLACEPRGMSLWLQPYIDNNASMRCPFRSEPPPKPDAFHGNWTTALTGPLWGVVRYECASIAYLRQNKVRLWNLDDMGIYASLSEWIWAGRDDPCGSLEETAGSDGAAGPPRRNRTRNAPVRTLFG